MTLNQKILNFSAARVQELAAFIARTWIALLGITLIIGVLLGHYYWNWEFWTEYTFYADGKIKESKLDKGKVGQQVLFFGLAALGLALAIWRSVTAGRQARAALKQADIGLRQVEIAERGQNVERYSKGAQMLDSDHVAVRQAGLYALRELSSHDPENYETIVADLLRSYINYRSFADGPELTEENINLAKVRTKQDILDAFNIFAKMVNENENTRLVRFDSKILVQPESLRNGNWRKFMFFDFRWRYVRGSAFAMPPTFFQGVFEYCGFGDCDFSYTNFSKVKFEDTDFAGCDLTGAIFRGCTEKLLEFLDCNVSQMLIEDFKDFRPEVLSTSWAWHDTPPILPEGVSYNGDLYDPGDNSKNRIEYTALRAKIIWPGGSKNRRPNEAWKNKKGG